MGHIVGRLFDDSGGSLVVSDLEVDSPTLVIDETNNRVGVGVTDPDSTLEVLSTTTQQKWSYDADSFATLTVADASHTTIATGESGDLILDAADDIILDSNLGKWRFKRNGTLTCMVSTTSGDGSKLVFDNQIADAGYDFKCSDGGVGITALAISAADAGAATFNGAVTVGTDLIVTGGDIQYGNGQNATMTIAATAHGAAGKTLTIKSGDTTAGTTNNIAGGSLTIQAGQGKGTGAGGDIVFQTANAGTSGSSLNALATALTISDDKSATFTGPVIALSAMASSGPGNTFVTFSDGDGTPSVATGNLFKHHASTETITMFDDGISGQIITVISTAAITYDVTGTNLKGGSADIVTANGDVTQWCFDGTNWYLLQFMDVSADHSTIGGGGGAAANDVDHILHQQIFS